MSSVRLEQYARAEITINYIKVIVPKIAQVNSHSHIVHLFHSLLAAVSHHHVPR